MCMKMIAISILRLQTMPHPGVVATGYHVDAAIETNCEPEKQIQCRGVARKIFLPR